MLEDHDNDFNRFDGPAKTDGAADRDRLIGYQEIVFSGGREGAERTFLNEIGIIWSHIRISQSAEIASRILLTGVHIGQSRMILRIETTRDLRHVMPEQIWMGRNCSDRIDMHPPTVKMREAVQDAVFPKADGKRLVGVAKIAMRTGHEDDEEIAVAEIGTLWSTLRMRVGAKLADMVVLKSINVHDDAFAFSYEAPTDRQALTASIAEIFGKDHAHERFRHERWSMPTQRMEEARHLAIYPDGPKAIDELLHALKTVERNDVRPGKVRSQFVRISVDSPGGWNHESSSTRLQTLVRFIKSRYRHEPDEATCQMSVMGTLSSSEFMSVVLHVSDDVAKELSIENPHTSAHSFDEADLSILSWDLAPQLSVALGCEVGAMVEAETPSKGAVVLLSSNAVFQHVMMIARLSMELLTTWAGISITAWRRTGEPRIRASTASLPRRDDVALWDMLESCLPEDGERIQTARTKIGRFERISRRWGDAESAHTASSVDGLVRKISRELEDVVMWAKPMETLAASARVLATLERLADRADEEGDRLSAGIVGTLDATCRYVDSKLDDAGLRAVPGNGEQTEIHDVARAPERIGY